jgi:hypothetical protein
LIWFALGQQLRGHRPTPSPVAASPSAK